MKKKGVAAWLNRLETEHSIALAETLSKMNQLTESEDTSAAELTAVVLQDPSLTTQVIRVSNTVHFNHTGEPVTTVSRAILNIGFDAVRTICMSVKIVENILKKGPGELLLDTLAASIHSAVQARNLSRQRANECKEEVFVAALLLHLAELMVLSSGEPEVYELERAIKWDASREEKDRAAERIIGVSFKRLAQALAKHWHLGGVLQEVMVPSEQPSVKAQSVLFGDRISRLIHKGWGNAEVKSLLNEIAMFTDKPAAKIQQQIMDSAKEASEVAARYGNEELRTLIPVKEANHTQSETETETETDIELSKPNPQLQQAILKELVQLMGDTSVAMNSYFQMTLEGLNRGVGLDRVTMAFFDKEKKNLNAKYVMGIGTKEWRQSFQFKYEPIDNNFLFQMFSKGQPVWIGSPEFDELKRKITSEYRMITGVREFLIAPLKIKSKQIGFLYADMGLTKQALNKGYFDGFRQFSQQVNMFLTIISNRAKK